MRLGRTSTYSRLIHTKTPVFIDVRIGMWKSIQTPCGQFIFIEAEVVAELMQVGGADFVAVEFLPGPSEIPDVF